MIHPGRLFAVLAAVKINEPANTSHDRDHAALPMWQRSEGQHKSSRETSSKTNTIFVAKPRLLSR